MDKLIVTIARGLVEDKDAVSVTVDEPNEEGLVVYHLHVAPDDMGRVIGKQGRIAKAIRTVVRAAANKAETKVAVTGCGTVVCCAQCTGSARKCANHRLFG